MARTTIDGLTIYDLLPQASELWVVAGPAGYDPKEIDMENLPEGFRWVESDEWEVLQKLAGFNHCIKDGFEYCDLPLPIGVETEVLLTAGGIDIDDIVGCGTIYGVFDSAWHARQADADERTIATLGASALPQELRDLAARNSARL
jgi:hypothetical protein